ncbi:MAG TPA: hypothetical protein VKA70_16285 [Blastocatellia bacterium]|nr:hypothetical protein [Blastocatellia bacterium]
MAAARGLFPLTNEEMLEALVVLSEDESPEIRSAASETIETLKPESFATLASDTKAPADVLGFLCVWPRAPREIVEATVFNRTTPDAVLARLAALSRDPRILEAISLKQQSLIRSPAIIEAILTNPERTPEAERRAREVREEFFEKRFGARLVADEQRAQAQAEEAARAAEEARQSTVAIEGIEDLVRLGLVDEAIDDTFIIEYEAEYGPFDSSVPAAEVQNDIAQAINDLESVEGAVLPERLPVFQQIALMSIKDRVMLAIKGTREARLILIRDPNRIVAGAVLRNPRLTDTEVENIASIKTVPEDVLRQIGQNRAWTRSYTVIHNLVRNPRTPIAQSLGFLNRIQTRDMRALSTNKNIPDVIRTTAARLYIKRSS